MPAFTDQPVFQLNASGRTPLSGLIAFSTDEPARVRLTLLDSGQTTVLPAGREAAQDHGYPVLGLKAGRAYELRTEILNDNGGSGGEAHTLTFETDPLPDDLPPMQVRISAPERMEKGVTMFGIRKSARFGAMDYGYLLAVDHAGDVVWLYRTGHTFGDVTRLSNGNILYLSFDNRAIELDMLGNTVNTWIASRSLDPDQVPDGAIAVDTETFHHELIEMPGGNFAVLSTEMRELDDYPSSDTDENAPRERANVVGDVIAEFKPDGTVVNSLSMFDVVDPYRIGYLSLGGFWVAKGYPASKDWSHANAMDYDASDDTFIVSLRHQDAVIKIDRSTGALKWILGTPDGWKAPWAERLLQPQGDLEWQYHQHNAHLTGDGNVLLFDNGNYRAMPFAAKLPPGENYSRGVEFAVDEDNATVSQVWSYGGPGESEYSAFLSGLRRLPETGNALINFGGLLSDDDGNPAEFPPKNIGWIRMIEVTGGATPELVWDLVIDERANGMGYDVYRAERFASLYG